MSWVSIELLAHSADSTAKKGLLPLTDDLFQHEAFISEALKFLGTSLPSQSSATLKNPTRLKDNKQSSSLREQGNQFFCSSSDLKNLEQALELYTKSIAYATPGSTELALAYANRAFALLKLNRPKECLKDLDRASGNNYPKDLESKLWARRGDAYAKLAEYNYIAAKHWLNKIPLKDRSKMEVLENYSASNYKDTIDVVRKVPVLQSPSDKYPYCSDAIEIQYSGKFGKKVVATRDIDVMETLIVDVPYSLNPLMEYFYTHCSYCMDSFFNGIPCDGCINVLYCSKKCKDLAWEGYHCYECGPIRDCVMQMQPYEFHIFDRMSHAVRLLLQMQHEAGGLQQLKERVIGFYRNDNNGVRDKDRWYRERSLETVLMVDSNIFNAPPGRIGLAAIVALCSLYYLGTTTNFFGTQYTADSNSMNNFVAMSQNPDVKFTGALLLKLTMILWTNCVTCNEVVLDNLNKYFRGILFLPLSGTLKPECHYNISGQRIENYNIINCVRPIKKGEELTMPFGREWFNHKKAERQERLMINKSIQCNCLACTRNWPTMHNLQSYRTLPLSGKSKAKISRVLTQYCPLQKRIHNGDIPEPERTLAELKRTFKEVYEEVDFPCLELTSIFDTIPSFYQMTGNVSKLKKLHTTPSTSILP